MKKGREDECKEDEEEEKEEKEEDKGEGGAFLYQRRRKGDRGKERGREKKPNSKESHRSNGLLFNGVVNSIDFR